MPIPRPATRCGLVCATLVTAWLATAGVASAAVRPDASIASLSAPPAASQAFTVRDSVRLQGRAASASVVRYYLSRDKRKDRRDVRLGGKRRLARGAGTTKVTVPRRAKPAAYYLIACADDTARMRESNERNNCRPARRRVALVARDPRPNPVKVEPQPDTARAATRPVGSAGGRLEATAADGTRFTLTIPDGAIGVATSITMTPLAAIGGLPFESLVGAVQLEPDGLRLARPATLTIEPARAVPGERLTPFAYVGAGDDLHLHPRDPGQATIDLRLTHFSGWGAADATRAQFDSQGRRTPTNREARSRQTLARLTKDFPNVNRARLDNELYAAFYVWGNEGVRQSIEAAIADPLLTPHAAQELISWYSGWTRYQEFALIRRHPELAALQRDLMRAFGTAFRKLRDLAKARCFDEHRLRYGSLLLEVSRTAALLEGFGGESVDAGAAASEALACLNFELTADSTMTGLSQAGGDSHNWSHAWKMRFPFSAQVGEGAGYGPMEYLSFVFSGNTGGCTSTGGSYRAAGPFEIGEVQLDIGSHRPLDEPPRFIAAKVLPPAVENEIRTTCPQQGGGSQTFSQTTDWFGVNYLPLYAPDDFRIGDWQFVGGEVWARREHARTQAVPCDGGQTCQVTERTTWTIRHTPVR